MSIFGALLRIKRWTSAETCDFLKVVIIVAASMLIREIGRHFFEVFSAEIEKWSEKSLFTMRKH